MWIIRFSDLARVIKIDREVLVNPKDSGSSVPLKEHLLALIADQHDMAMQRDASVALRFECWLKERSNWIISKCFGGLDLLESLPRRSQAERSDLRGPRSV